MAELDEGNRGWFVVFSSFYVQLAIAGAFFSLGIFTDLGSMTLALVRVSPPGWWLSVWPPAMALVGTLFGFSNGLWPRALFSVARVWVYPPLMRGLEYQVHWRGALMILSGSMLQLLVLGALIRPSNKFLQLPIKEVRPKSSKVSGLK